MAQFVFISFFSDALRDKYPSILYCNNRSIFFTIPVTGEARQKNRIEAGKRVRFVKTRLSHRNS